MDALFLEEMLIEIYLSSFNRLMLERGKLDRSISDKQRQSCDRDRIISFYLRLASSNSNLNCL